jgi:diguanylate cyclase (GGDEF)-like protein
MSDDVNAILPQADQMSRRYARAIIEFTTAVIHTGSVEEVLWLLTDDIVSDLGFEDCVVYILDESRGKLIQKAAYGNKKAGPSEILDPIEIDLGQGITGRCAIEQQPILVNDVTIDPSYVVDDIQRMSELAVPILSQGKTIGVIDSEHSEKEFYTSQHLATLRALSAIITTKYENTSALRELKASEARLRHLANHDSLCGLPNRHCFVTELSEAAERFSEGKLTTLCVLIMDLDRFKVINDSYGHAAGDQLIVRVSERLRSLLPESVLLARLSGDEFAVLSTDASDGGPAQLCETILGSFSERLPIVAADVRISASIGVAEASSEISTASALMKLADGAMYKAKARGKGCYVLSRGGEQVASLSDLNLETAIASALERSEFQVYLQPIVNLTTGRASSFESLIRWVHPKIGLIRPDYFIDFAERSGQIRDIDLYMIQRVGGILTELRRDFQRELAISVNVSASLLSRSDWIDQMDDGTFANGLNIEVTERALVADVSVASATLEALQARGSQIYIDDFGTGYSSLSYLHRLPLDVIKIDRSFVDSITESEKSQSLVQLLVSLARSMEVELVAEGIETPEQLALLKSLDVRYGQGYLFARPMPFSDVWAYLKSQDS